MMTENMILWKQALLASIVAVGLSLFGYALNHQGLGAGMFLLVPFCTGLSIAFMSQGRKIIVITAMTSLLLSFSVLIFSGLEGLGCVIMAFPILFISVGVGALFGFLIGKKFVHQYGNITVIALCLGIMMIVGWTNKKMSTPKLLVVETSMNFNAPMKNVWAEVVESKTLKGDEALLKLLGLPIPYSCTLSEEGQRICYFDQGEMIQQVTVKEYGKSFKVDIVDALHVRDWIKFIDAGYEFIQKEGYVQVIRTDRIESTLRPRWYWHWFEEKCVQAEHRYVLLSMKAKAEQ